MSVARRSLHRQSGATEPSRTQPRRELPNYEPLAHPLNANAQRKLETLLRTHSTDKLDQHIRAAILTLQENVFGVTDNVVMNEHTLSRQKAKLERQQQGAGADATEVDRLGELETELQGMKTKVERMTKQMDDRVRKMIDDEHSVANVHQCVKDLAAEASSHGMHSEPSQAANIPRSSRRTQTDPTAHDNDNDNQDEGEAEHPTASASQTFPAFTPTDPTAGPTQTQPTAAASAPSTAFRATLQRLRDKYQTYTPRQRYAQNNHYRQFRKTWHDASYPETADGALPPPMPHESTWFAAAAGEGRAAQPGHTGGKAMQDGDGNQVGAGAENEEDDDDDDIAIQRERISTKCPLTLRAFVDPVTSTKCPHSFERSAIEGMISASAVRLGGGGRHATGPRAVQCPVPGCTQMLAATDLGADVVLRRKIARLLRAERMEAEEEEEDRGEEEGRDVDELGAGRRRKRAIEVESGDEIEDEREGRRASGRRMKVESSARSRAR